MDQAVADEYKSSLNDLNFNSKPLINMLTMLADENKKHAATIVKTIVDHINSAPLEAKLPGLYLVDSIMKNLGDEYMKIFCQQIVSLFTSVFEKVDENTRSLMFKLRQTWTDVLPNKILYNLDLSVKKLDPAWPVTAKNPKKILINPKFIDGSSEKKKTSESPVDSTPLKKEEDQIKQKQGEVLKQLLAKQEQLRQLEIQKLQLSIKKNNTPVGSNVPASSTFKKNLRDPRMVKINVSQNISPIKPCSNRVAQEKPVVVSKLEVCQNNSNISSTKSTTSVTKTHAQTSFASNMNHVENCVKASNHQMVQQKKTSPKNKTDKNTMNKSKQAPFSSSKVGELKCALTENTAIASKAKHFVKSDKIEELKCSLTENTAIISKAKPFVKSDKIEELKCSLTENTAITNKAKPFVKSNKIEGIKCSVTENTAIASNAKPFVKNDKIEDLKCNLAENTAITSKANKPLVKTDTCSVQILEKSFKDFSKRLKMVHKKKNTPVNHKMPQLNTTNASGVLISKKASPVKIPKKSEKQKYPSKSDLSSSCKVISKDEKDKDQFASFVEYIDVGLKHNITKLNDIANKLKSVKKNDSQESVSDLSVIAKKDEDLRVKPISLKEDTASVRVPKRDIVETSSLVNEMDPPRKKIRGDDTENCNPENRSELPDLFGSEDQDLRLAPFSDMNSKDWSQYKANHPDEYSPSPAKQESFEGKNRFRKHQFSDKYYNSPDYDRFYPRHSRGRYFAKRNFHRKYFPRGSRGKFPYNSPLASVMLDSRAFLRQAEEKFLSGRLSETEYIDLRRDLQKMVESSEYELFRSYSPQKQEMEHHVRLPENEISKQEFEHEPERVTLDNIRIQRSSLNPPPEKTFVLDDKERTVHFIDDKAIVLMDDNVPCELTFKDEQREVYIDGMAEPLSMGFDGKSVEFQVDGRRHVMRFGIPGRELYINDHPFEAQFGGPPLVAMLDDGHVYKIHVAGPAPQVVIGTEPQYELFAKHNHDGANTSKVQDSNVKYDIPSSCSLQDVDMRMKPDSVSEHDILLNKDSPFYCEDMKDIDWRKMPPSSSLKETEKDIKSIVKENVASSYETWINEDSLNSTSIQDRNNEAEKSVPKDATHYQWERTEQEERSQPQDDLSQQRQHPLAHVQQQRPHPPEDLSQQRPHPPEDLSQQRQHPLAHVQQQRPHPPEDLSQQRPHPPEDLSQQRQHPLAHVQQQRPHPPEDFSQQRPHPPEDLSQQRQHPLAHVQQQRPHPPEDFSQQRPHPPEDLSQQRQHPLAHVQQQRPHPPEDLSQQRQHPMEHVQQQSEHLMKQPEHLQRQHPREHIQQQSEHLMEHPEHLQRQHPPEHVQQHPSMLLQQNQHPSVHMQPQHSSVHMQQHHQHQSVHMQPQEPLHSENALPVSTSQKWTYKRDNNYWQNDHFRKNHHSSYLEESSAYHRPTQAPSNQHFEDQGKYASRPHSHPHPHPSYAPYPQRSSFQARHGRGRYPGPRYRFNADFGRPRQNTPLLEPPRPRFPAELHKPLLPPPPFPPPFLSTSVSHQADRDVPARASTEIQNRPGLLPTPVLKSESPQAEPKMQVDIESLLEKLVAAGIINTKMYEEAEPESEITDKIDIKTDDDKEAEEASSEMEKIELTPESLRIHRPSLISLLHKGLQCATCGMRFKEMQNEQYSRHLDWHFRMNRREKDTKRAISRTWYFEIEDWIQFEEFDDFEERTPSYFELQADDNQPEVVEVPAVLSVPATNDDQECCPVCLEKFQLFWVEDEEEWHFRNAVRHDNVTYHPACYEDFKKSCEAESALKKSEDTTNDSTEIEQDLKDILNTLIEDVGKNVEVMDVPHQTDLPNAMEDVEVPPAEVHSEEEILEGKPGEEEIIGLISESDIEIDSECPKSETKMVVMQSGGITLKVKAESLQCHSPSNSSEKDTKVEDGKQVDDEEEIDFRPPTPDPNFEVQPPVSKGRELSGLCCIM